VGEKWSPPRLQLFVDDGEADKPEGDFPSFGGVVPLLASKSALELLQPLIERDVEVLDIHADFGDYFALNVLSRECLDREASVLKRFRDGGIMAVEAYAFLPKAVENAHVFRIPEEIMSCVFVDEAFKTAVEEGGLKGLLFYHIPLAADRHA
jgi:hypothetical protein